MICKKLDATTSTFLWFCSRSSFETFDGSSTKLWPGGMPSIVLMRGTMRFRRYVYPWMRANADSKRVQVELPRKSSASLSTPLSDSITLQKSEGAYLFAPSRDR
jgi:hypothetical protein